MKIGIIGLGLIGGSLFKKLRQKGYQVIGVDTHPIETEGVFQDLHVLSGCDIVFVCTPMRAILKVLDTLNTFLSAKTIVADVGSVKTFVCQKKYRFCFIPTHPMAGTEHTGWTASFPQLFEGKKWVITPLTDNPTAQNTLTTLLQETGADILMTTPAEHDKAVAFISHMPHLVAYALCACIKDNSLAQQLAASCFRDMTRVAKDNSKLMSDMWHFNGPNIGEATKRLIDLLQEMHANLSPEQLESINDFRKKLYP